ncbi:nucleotide exchange factor GrpE [Treponema sp.]
MSKHDAQGNERHKEKKRSQSEEKVVTTEEKAEEVVDFPQDKGIQDLVALVASLEEENSNLKDQYLRKAAEFENFRKRMNREKQDAIDFANQSLLLDLIPVIDDFERAIKSSEDARNYDNLHEGISLIERRLVSQLENKWGLVRFESLNTAFDPNRHEAIMMEKSSKVSEPTVSEDFLKGYILKDRVVRSAKVKVLMPEAEKPADENMDATSDTSN